MNTATARTTAVAPRRRNACAQDHAGACARTAAIEAAIIGALMVALVAAVVASGAGASVTPATISIQVEPGETIWEIAASHSASGQSIGEIVDEIGRINGLEDSTLRAGQTLYVPTSPDAAVALASK